MTVLAAGLAESIGEPHPDRQDAPCQYGSLPGAVSVSIRGADADALPRARDRIRRRVFRSPR